MSPTEIYSSPCQMVAATGLTARDVSSSFNMLSLRAGSSPLFVVRGDGNTQLFQGGMEIHSGGLTVQTGGVMSSSGVVVASGGLNVVAGGASVAVGRKALLQAAVSLHSSDVVLIRWDPVGRDVR
jgi:hypothetical protein